MAETKIGHEINLYINISLRVESSRWDIIEGLLSLKYKKKS